jgi:hypothetical protein
MTWFTGRAVMTSKGPHYHVQLQVASMLLELLGDVFNNSPGCARFCVEFTGVRARTSLHVPCLSNVREFSAAYDNRGAFLSLVTT